MADDLTKKLIAERDAWERSRAAYEAALKAWVLTVLGLARQHRSALAARYSDQAMLLKRVTPRRFGRSNKVEEVAGLRVGYSSDERGSSSHYLLVDTGQVHTNHPLPGSLPDNDVQVYHVNELPRLLEGIGVRVPARPPHPPQPR